MRAVVQRTDAASVIVDNQEIANIGRGLTVLLGVGEDDDEHDVRYLADKVVNLRIFPDNAGKMNLSLRDINGELLVVSQFTLYGDCRKGRRPSFDAAAAPEKARRLYEMFIVYCRQQRLRVACGQFQAEMVVRLANHGPVTLLLDSKRIF
ncbi:D-aminoacyl-tRNA deacylase [Sporolituus thermophilus]|uniref:D-aminoacyl-tRNA deacylase n=1 Tax=Sporolituus thermophilus DSM 23256 TaxID=1123285 RepID=A0A1G7IDZ9_9FIRM|nr:D-aminoacyl-tRNA deacylase [Sporolituus thermophilus]SDF10970.1 D-tyrosyl-tRNA(Tyr) deacylase [Sporolituus thermophilus DSM 23256]